MVKVRYFFSGNISRIRCVLRRAAMMLITIKVISAVGSSPFSASGINWREPHPFAGSVSSGSVLTGRREKWRRVPKEISCKGLFDWNQVSELHDG